MPRPRINMGAFAKKPSGDAPSGSLASGSGTVLHESTNAAPPTKPACVPTLATGSAAGHRCGDLQINGRDFRIPGRTMAPLMLLSGLVPS